nr:copia protein [Tanacetum cinerariifolium]
ETVPDKDYILLPLWTQNPPFSSSSKDSPGAGYKPSGEEEKKDIDDPGNEDSKALITEEPRVNQKKDNVNSTNRVNAVSSTVNAASNEVNAVGIKSSIELPDDLNMPELEDINIFENLNEDVFGAEADLNNLESTFQVNPIPIIRIHKDHPLQQVIRDVHSAPQTRRMSKNLEAHGLVSSKWGFRKKIDGRGIVIRNKARLVAQGHTQEEGIDYDEGFAPVARIETIRLFLAYPSFKDFMVYQLDVKSAFLYGKIEEEIYVCQPLGYEDLDFPNKVYKVKKTLYGLHQALRACLKRRVKKLEKKASKKTHKLKRLYKIDELDADEGVTLVDETQERNDRDRHQNLRQNGTVIQEPSETPTPTPIDSSQQPLKAKDKDKAKMIELEKPLKRKDQIMIDEEFARNLKAHMQAELEEEEKLARQKEKETNIALIE